MATITPITAFQNSPTSTASTTYVDANCETAVLSSGVDYLLYWTGQVGSNNIAGTAYLRLVHGSTVLSEVIDKETTYNTVLRTTQCNGATVITGNGTDTLKFQVHCTGGRTAFPGSLGIVAIPLDSLSYGSDYWFDGTNAATLEVTAATVGGWNAQRSASFSLPDAGNYLVFMSTEGSAASSGGSASNASMARFRVNGAALGQEYLEQWGMDGSWRPYQTIKLMSLGSGTNTFDVEVGSRSSALSNFRRSRVVVVRAASFDQLTQLTNSTGYSAAASTTEADFPSTDIAYVPNQTEPVLAIGHVDIGSSLQLVAALCQIYDVTNSIEYGALRSGDAGHGANLSSSNDHFSAMPMGCQTLTGGVPRTFRFRVVSNTANAGVTSTWGRDKVGTTGVDSHLILWGLTTAAASGYTLTADAGAYSVSGAAAGLAAGRRLSAGAASYSTSWGDAGLTASRSVSAATGAYNLSGADVALVVGHTISAEAGTVNYSGADAALILGASITADAGAYPMDGAAAILTYSGTMNRTAILVAMTQRERITTEVSRRERMAVTFSQRERIAVEWS